MAKYTPSSTTSAVEKTHHEIPCYIDKVTGKFVNADEELLDHLHSVIESSKTFLRSNDSWPIIEICKKIMGGVDDNLAGVSRGLAVEIRKLRRQGRELIGNASNIRPNFEIRSANTDEATADKTATYEQLKTHWWNVTNVDKVFKEAVDEGSFGLGYIFLWPRRNPNTGKWEICPKALSYKECFPYQVPADNDIDKAYSFTVWCEIPFAEFKELFPTYKNSLKPDRSAPTYLGRRFKRTKEAFSGIRGMLKRGMDNKTEVALQPSFPMKDVFYTFTRDMTLNETDSVIKMGTLVQGDLAGHDSYDVKPGERLFPRRRLTIWTKEQILQDGPPKWISDCVPVVDLAFERRPKQYVGVPVINDGRSMEAAINRAINSILDRIHGAANFPIGVDDNALGNFPKTAIEKLKKGGIRTLIGKAIMLNFRTGGTPIKELFSREFFNVQNHEFEMIKSLYELQDYVVGTNDYSNLQRKNQVPAADTQEALVRSMGVLSVEHDREISSAVLRFGRIWLQFAPQVFTLRERVLAVGANALDLKDLGWEPESMIPSLDPQAEEMPYWKRLANHLERFSLFAVLGSLQEKQSITNKLTLLQMLKSGVSISSRKLYDTFIGDGKYDATRSEWIAEQKENAELAAKIRTQVEAITGAAGSPEGAGIIQQITKMLEAQNTSNLGRPSTDRTAPRQEVKTDEDGTLRATSATN